MLHCFTDDSQVKFVSTNVTFKGVLYKNGMSVCVSKTKVAGNSKICLIKHIIIKSSLTNISFIRTKEEIILNIYVGVFEIKGIKKEPYFPHSLIPLYYLLISSMSSS